MKTLEIFLKEAKKQNAMMAFLPECFYSLGNGKQKTPYLVSLENEHYQNIQKLAQDFNIYLIGGSAATLENNKVYNRTYNFSPEGSLLSQYDKRSLFSCELKDKKIRESDIYSAGSEEILLDVLGIKIGLGICFDIRYSSLAWSYRQKGAQILTYASAFTVPTGKAHWHILNRARAIENQLFVISSAQTGLNDQGVKTFGHSLVVDPWGEVLVDAKEDEGVFCCDLDFELILKVRSQVKMD